MHLSGFQERSEKSQDDSWNFQEFQKGSEDFRGVSGFSGATLKL